VYGHHSLLGGAEFKYTKAQFRSAPIRGQFTYTSAASLLNNQPTQAIIALGSPIINYTSGSYYFLQDDWKVRQSDAESGIRYEYTGQPINDLRDLQLPARATATGFCFPPCRSNSACCRSPPTRTTLRLLWFCGSPKFEHAAQGCGRDATVVRGGSRSLTIRFL
jgi:hypothetical protein